MRPLPRRRLLQALSVLPLWPATRSARAQGGAVHPAPSALGYLPWWMAPGWEALAWRKLERLVLFDAPVQRDGSVVAREWPQRLPALRERAGLPVDLALTLMQQKDFDAVFGSSSARRRLLGEARRWCGLRELAGLHLDFEGFDGPARADALAGFRAWLVELDEMRRENAKALSVFFPADDRFAPYDAAGAPRIDYWVAQLYDAHWPESKAAGPLVTRREENPVAVPRALRRLAALGVERGRVLLSVPLYGWEWPTDSATPGATARARARLLTFARTPEALMPNDRRVARELARRHGLRRDAEHTPYYVYREVDGWVQGWYEDARSLARKLAPERAAGYAGLAFFALGYDGGELIDAMLDWWRAPQR